MKQRISVEQLEELTPEQQEKLREWWKPEDGDWFHGEIAWDVGVQTGCYFNYKGRRQKDWLPLLSIGQMIELIRDKQWHHIHGNSLIWWEDPCDGLWWTIKRELAKEVLR